jgi:hypothetical protein
MAVLGAVVVLLGMALVAATILAGPPAAATGTVKFDRDWYPVGGQAKITVTDADANTTTPASQSITLTIPSALGTEPHVLTLGAGEEIIGTPIALTDNSTCLSGTQDAGLNVTVFNASAGSIVIQSFA